jgi:hypothetical protein
MKSLSSWHILKKLRPLQSLSSQGWFRLVFEITDQINYQLIVTQHHFGHQDDSYAIGALLEFIEPESDAKSIRNLQDDNFRHFNFGPDCN